MIVIALCFDNNFGEKKKGEKGKEEKGKDGKRNRRKIALICIRENKREMKGYKSFLFKSY